MIPLPIPRLVANCFALALVLLLVPGCAERSRFAPLPPGAVVLAFGDSVTAGMGASAGRDYPARLAAVTGWHVVNAGVSGDTARAARDRLAPLLAAHHPALVIVEMGGNDFLRQVPATQVRESLRAIVREALESGAVVALVAVPRLSLLRAGVGALADSPIYAELAAQEDVVLVADVFSDILSSEALRADQIHPNAQGYALLADGIAAAFEAAGLFEPGPVSRP